MPWPIIAGAAAVLGSAVIGGASNNKTNKSNLEINQMNNEFNERMMQKQMDYNTMMWEKNNEYNTPLNQRKRFEDAGINPYMAMGQINSGSAQSAGSTSAASAAPAAPQQSYTPNLQGIPEAVLMSEQANLTKLQAQEQVIDNQSRQQKNMAELANIIANTKNTKIKNKLANTQYQYADQMHQLQIQNNQLVNDNLKEQTQKIIRENMLLDKNLSIFDERTQIEIAERASRIALSSAQERKTKQETIHEVQKMIETVARTNGIKISNNVSRRTADSLVEKAMNEAVPHYNITQLPSVGAHAFGKGLKYIKDKIFD